MFVADPAFGRARRRWPAPAVFAVYLIFSAVATWPLVRDMGTKIISDPGDPLLNTSILAWNATTWPFSEQWWNAPHYFPSRGVTTFTENLLGASPIATPVYFFTRNAFLAHNLTLFLTWPLSGLAVFLLVRRLAHHDDAAFLAGLAFAFTPYRAMAFGHLQTLATFGVPMMLAGLHGFLEERRSRWLVLFGVFWVQQGLANGYYILYGGLVVSAWLVYFCSVPDKWKAGAQVVAAWAVASIPLVPVLVRYRRVHEELGLHRTLNEILYFSATPASWLEVDAKVWLWRSILSEGKDNLYPGIAAVVLAVAGISLLTFRRRAETAGSKPRERVRLALGAIAALSVIAILIGLRYGKIDTTIASIPIKQRSLDRPLALVLLAGGAFAVMTPRLRAALTRRSPLVFYAIATLLFAFLACGPVLRVGNEEILSPAPYGWLMMLPGFNELRVPTQIKMIDIMCLAVTAGLVYSVFKPQRAGARAGLYAIAALGIMLDGWMTNVPMVDAPTLWAEVEPSDRMEPILELPLGPDGDFAATYRASLHHRRVFNGVSGYDPPHYYALREGLAARDPAMLSAVATLGAFDIVVNRAADPDGATARYAAAAPGAVKILDSDVGTLYRVPAASPPPELGETLPIAEVRAVRHDADWALMHDGRLDTKWGDNPQAPDQWIVADLGSPREVGGVTNVLGEELRDFPRRLSIDVSLDAEQWDHAWEGSGAPAAFLAFVREPRRAALHFAFPPRQARFIRLRQLASVPRVWWVLELLVHAPAANQAAR